MTVEPSPARARAARYAVKEIFYTLQGEGAQAGRAAVFCRFAGCNLWSGREADRGRGAGGCAAWCDTDFVGIDGAGGGRFDAAGLAAAVTAAWRGRGGRPLVVCTGGEPLLQLDDDAITALHAAGFEIAIETNGTVAVPAGIDWVCVSPKAGAPLVVTGGDELKLVVPQVGLAPADVEHLAFRHWFVQPKAGPDAAAALAACLAHCLAHPRWRLSVQVHKLVGLP